MGGARERLGGVEDDQNTTTHNNFEAFLQAKSHGLSNGTKTGATLKRTRILRSWQLLLSNHRISDFFFFCFFKSFSQRQNSVQLPEKYTLHSHAQDYYRELSARRIMLTAQLHCCFARSDDNGDYCGKCRSQPIID